MLIRWGRNQDAPPAIGDVLFVKLKLPSHPMFGQRWMLFNASVVRVTHTEPASPLVAVAGEPVLFRLKQISRELPEGRHERHVCEVHEIRRTVRRPLAKPAADGFCVRRYYEDRAGPSAAACQYIELCRRHRAVQLRPEADLQ
jgi:hypothetical protein